MLNVLYFASLRETFGIASEHIALPAPATVAALIVVLRARGDSWFDALGPDKRWRVAVNEEMAVMDTVLQVGDAVAIFPPVTGG
ncbi:MAG: molybdopterin converting factor subunit 1 [Burkholderiales bacterium]|nr:molybdopterin converting factor subunit 1 [Burkholderiales bacterium]